MRTYIALFSSIALAVSAFAAQTPLPDEVTPYPFPTYFMSDPVPESVTPIGNPLDWAGAKIGLDVRNVELPRGFEGEYRFNCRFPIIDYVSNRPLYMKQWTEDNAAMLERAYHDDGGVRMVGHAVTLLTGAKSEGKLPDLKSVEIEAFDKALKSSPFGDRYCRLLSALFQNYCGASEMVRDGLRSLTPEDSAYFAKNPVAFLLPDGEKMTDLTGNISHQTEYVNRLRNARLDDVMTAGELFAPKVANFVKEQAHLEPDGFYKVGQSKKNGFEFSSSYGKIIISGNGDDLHAEDAAILIDLGGSDTYTNNSGSATRGVALCIDYSGDDIYDAKDRRYVQGCGLFGVGMLVDLDGNDSYTAKYFAQGAGIAGIGALYDGGGNDVFSGHGFTQGAAMFGLGMLMNCEGDDSYACATLSQGGATTMGLGILWDYAGNDQYKLGTDPLKDNFNGMSGYGQGGALSFRPSPWRGKFTPYGGVGMLIDGSGDDDYLTNGWCDQGGSYIMSLGSLYDGGGNDHYKANTGQGSGIHITNAILVDKSGDDSYEGAFRTGGSGSDRSPGFLLDYAGNDTYKSGSSSYGTGCKPFSYSLMIDYSGDDKYVTADPVGPILFNCWDSFGGVWPESAPNLYPWAIFLDLGGKDDYQVRNRANNSMRHSFGHGLQIDMEWKHGDVIGKVAIPLEAYPPDFIRAMQSSDGSCSTLDQLGSANLFTRFSAIGVIAQYPDFSLSHLRSLLASSRHKQFNRDALECIHYYMVEKTLTDTMQADIAALLSAADPEVRTIIADDIGVFGLKSCEDALVTALDDPEFQVRRYSYRSLLALKSDKGLEKALIAVKKDKSEDVRRVALGYIANTADKSSLYPMLVEKLENDPASSVHVAAADALARLGDDKAVPVLQKFAKTGDVYLQRAIAKALCEFYQVEGIGVLIESLSFPSIDAFFNYDYNVPNFISTYSGHDFPDPDRYDQAKWRAWFAENRDKIPIKENVDAVRAYNALGDSLKDADDDKLIAVLERFLSKHPNHRNAAGALAANLNRISWDMATAPAGTPRFNPTQAIVYGKRACELVDEPNYWDTYAEALFAAGKYTESAKICDEQLVKSPGNKMFTDRLEKIKNLKK